MWHLSSESNILRRFVSVSLIASVLFLTPFSFSFSVDFTHAEEASSTSAAATGTAGDGGESGAGGAGGNGGNADTGGTTGDQDLGATSTVSGGEGGNGGEESATTTEIETGNSTTSVDVTNMENNNSVTLNSGSSTVSTTTDPADDESDENTATSSAATSTPAIDASVVNESDATASTTIDIENASGNNAATSTGPVSVKSGDVISNANLLNVVNTNLVNSYGELLILSNMLRNSVGQFDIRSLGFFLGGNFSCVFCGGSDLANLSVLNNGTALLASDLSAHATSGGNSAASGSTSTVSSGNAYAAGNVINFANNNVVDSNFLFLTYNNFGDSDGDIVFPNAETLLKILGGGKPIGSDAELSNFGDATVADNLTLNATSGNNSFQSFGSTSSSTVTSGNSGTSANILNLINSNLLGGGSMNVLFNVQGKWSGTIFGLPPGVDWKDTGHGFVLSFDSFENIADTVSGATSTLSGTIANSGSATITNNLDIGASSGDNSGSGTNGSVESGDAYAAANVINVANTNMIGRNMFWAIINIFGDWSGNLSFGKPDLWIGGHADMNGATVGPNGTVTYHFTVINNGDLAATGVKVRTDLGTDHLKNIGSEAGRIVETVLGSIAPKESKTFDITASADSGISSEKEMVTTSASVTSVEKDNNSADNTEQVAVVLGKPHRSSHSSRSRQSAQLAAASLAAESTTTTAALAPLELSQSLDGPATVNASSTVDYSVKIYNPNNTPVYNAEYHQRVLDANGGVMHGEVWDLGPINPHEEIDLSYSVFFSSDSPAGVYTNTSFVSATRQAATSSEPLVSNVAMTPVTVLAKKTARPFVNAPSLVSPLSTPTASSSSTSAASSIEQAPASGHVDAAQAINYGGNAQGLLASAFFGSPTGKQLSTATIILLVLTLGIMAFRRRYQHI